MQVIHMDDSKNSAAVLIIKNLVLFTDALMYFESEVQPRVFREIDDLHSGFIKNQGWVGQVGYMGRDDGSWMMPYDWKSEDGEDLFWFGFEDLSTDDRPELAVICGLADAPFAFFFRVGHRCFGGKKKFQALYEPHQAYLQKELSAIGFTVHANGEFSYAVNLDLAQLADGWAEDDLTSALEPIGKGLEKIKQAADVLSNMIADAKAKRPLE
jgi:hypothetical protein